MSRSYDKITLIAASFIVGYQIYKIENLTNRINALEHKVTVKEKIVSEAHSTVLNTSSAMEGVSFDTAEALRLAHEALEKAEDASSDAEQAKNDADEAEHKASLAMSEAEEAKNDADEALTEVRSR